MNQPRVHHRHDQPLQLGGSLAPSADMAYSYGPSPKQSSWDHSTEPVQIAVKFSTLNQMLEFSTH